MRNIHIDMADDVVALPHHQHEFWRLDEIEKSLIDVESRDAGRPAAGLAIIDGLAAHNFSDGLLQTLFREIRQIGVVDVSPPKAGFPSRFAVTTADMGMGRIVAHRRWSARHGVESGAAPPTEPGAGKIRNRGLR